MTLVYGYAINDMMISPPAASVAAAAWTAARQAMVPARECKRASVNTRAIYFILGVASSSLNHDPRYTRASAERLQGFLAEAVGACVGRRTGLGTEVEAERSDASNLLVMNCSSACNLSISRVICSWPAITWSMLRISRG